MSLSPIYPPLCSLCLPRRSNAALAASGIFFPPALGSSSTSTGASSETSTSAAEASFSADAEVEESEQRDSQRQQRKFLMRWKLISPWIEVEDGGNDKLYCRECRSAKLKNAFAVGKNRPSGGWKKEYLQRHAVSNDHVKYASEDYRKTQTQIFDDNQLSVSMRASERETLIIKILIKIRFFLF